jgi:hypothetical protein
MHGTSLLSTPLPLLSRDVTHLLDPNIEKTTYQPEGLPILFLLVGKKKIG